MGLMDFFRLGQVAVDTAKAVRSQRSLGREIAALPMPAFIDAASAQRYLDVTAKIAGL